MEGGLLTEWFCILTDVIGLYPYYPGVERKLENPLWIFAPRYPKIVCISWLEIPIYGHGHQHHDLFRDTEVEHDTEETSTVVDKSSQSPDLGTYYRACNVDVSPGPGARIKFTGH